MHGKISKGYNRVSRVSISKEVFCCIGHTWPELWLRYIYATFKYERWYVFWWKRIYKVLFAIYKWWNISLQDVIGKYL